MSKQIVFDKIFTLPTVAVNQAYKKYISDHMAVSKAQAAERLAELVVAGKISIDDCIGQVTAPSSHDTAKVDAAAQAASRAESVALDALKQAKTSVTIAQQNHEQAKELDDALFIANDRIDQLKQSVDAIAKQAVVDPTSVNLAVTQAVADAFKPFKQAVEDAGAQDAIGSLVAATVVASKPCIDVFGIDLKDAKGKPVIVDIWDHANAPAVDDTFIWTETILRHLIQSQRTGENVWFGGDKGTGKTMTAQQFAARTGRNFVRINFEKHTEPAHYLGDTGYDPTTGTKFQPRDFLTAFTSPSTVILLDEVTNAAAGNLAPLNGFLEPRSAVSYGGAVWRRALGVLVFTADNTLGNGDDSGRYADTRQMNSSLVDRFARVVHFDFLPLEKEVEAVVNHTNCKPELARHVLKAVHVARTKVATGDVVDAPSIRCVLAFIRSLDMMSVNEAWDSTIVAKQPAESHAAIEAIKQACIDPSFIANNI
jgi:MoxR-like ATPase